MKKELWQNRQKVLTSDLEKAQVSKEDAISERVTGAYNPGIVKGSLNEFAFSITIGYTNRFTIDTGGAHGSGGVGASGVAGGGAQEAAEVTAAPLVL